MSSTRAARISILMIAAYESMRFAFRALGMHILRPGDDHCAPVPTRAGGLVGKRSPTEFVHSPTETAAILYFGNNELM